MIRLAQNHVENICIDEEWNFGDDSELLMHSIHPYPAKFPAFIASKAFDYAQKEGVEIVSVADIFCGCGTVALEAKIHEKDFWGCDINPVATLIAKTKSTSLRIDTLNKTFSKIIKAYAEIQHPENAYAECNERFRYWFTENSYVAIYRLKQAIERETRNGKYREAFLCIFSSILKSCSRWLTKSIKPQIDPKKIEIDVLEIFELHYKKFLRAMTQIWEKEINGNASINIKNSNFLQIHKLPKVDLIISSPPYVTSYEYADLHQLSILWLNYAEDYREVRKGAIGSIYNCENFEIDFGKLNIVGQEIVKDLLSSKIATSKVRSVGRYYQDMQKVIHKCSQMLNNAGMVFFVVGDTEYKGVKIKNSNHLIQCLLDEGFTDIKAAKRRISNKLLTPYRDSMGRFSSDKSQRTIYHEEFIISGRMWKA